MLTTTVQAEEDIADLIGKHFASTLELGQSVEYALGYCVIVVPSMDVIESSPCIQYAESTCDPAIGSCSTYINSRTLLNSSAQPIEIRRAFNTVTINGELAADVSDQCLLAYDPDRYFCFDLLPIDETVIPQ